MKKNTIILLILAGLSFNKFFTITSKASILNNNLSYHIRPMDKERIGFFWTTENEGFLNSSEKELLNELRIKVNNGNNLTIEEREVLSKLRGEAIRKKLGESRFERYKKLIEKREKQEKGKLEIELSKEEKAEIYNFEKEIRGK